LLPVLHRSDRWPALVRPMTPVRQMDRVGQAGGYSSRTTNVPESLSDFSGPWNKNTLKTQLARKKNPTQREPKHLQNCEELTCTNTTQRHTDSATHPRQIAQRAHTGQTGQENWSDRCNLGSSGLTESTSKLLQIQLPICRFAPQIQTRLWDSRNTSRALHSQVMVHQNSLNQEESKKSHQELL
jgi:hypothetical protein